MLRVDGVAIAAGAPALTFEVPDGRCVGLLGRDPATLRQWAETIAGLRAPVTGRILVDDLDSIRDATFTTRISVCLPSAAHRLTTMAEHVGTIAAARGSVRAPLAESLARLGLHPKTRLTTPASKSAAALAAALVPDLPAIVLHDPFAALDDRTKRHAIDWIRTLGGSRVSIVITGTEERDVRAVSHDVIEIGAGR